MKTLVQTIEIIEIRSALIVEIIWFGTIVPKNDVLSDIQSLLNYRTDGSENKQFKLAISQAELLKTHLESSRYDFIRLVHTDEIKHCYGGK